jgi:hypothetical protein
VKVLKKRRVVASGIMNAGVVVVAHRNRKQDLDPKTRCSFGKAIDERIVRLPVGAHEKLPLRAAARDHVCLAWQDLSRNGHAAFSTPSAESVVKTNLGGDA